MPNIARAGLLHGIGRWFEERDGRATLLVVGALLLDFLQLKFQGKDVTLFDTHQKTIWTSVTSLLGYCVASDVSTWQFSATLTYIADFCAWFCGHLTLASLASVVYPNSVTFVPYLLCFTPGAIKLLFCIYSTIKTWHFREKVMRVRQFFTNKCITNEMEEENGEA